MNLHNMTVDELEALKTEKVNQIRQIQDEIEEIEATEQAIHRSLRLAAAAREMARVMAGMSESEKSVVIAGATAGMEVAGETASVNGKE